MKVEISEKRVKKCLRIHDPSLVLGGRISGGGTSVVYNLRTGKSKSPDEALKVMDTRCFCQNDSNDPKNLPYRKKAWQYFHTEVEAQRELTGGGCRYIMPVLDAFEEPLGATPQEVARKLEQNHYRALFFIRMPKFTPLDRFMNSNMSERALLRMSMDICQALQECENHKILHRDVKPENIFVTVKPGARRRKENAHFILGDFGVCRRMEQLNIPVTNAGTNLYKAPEIGRRTPLTLFNSDIYSLGASLYYLIRGGFPEVFYDGYLEENRDMLMTPENAQGTIGISQAFSDIIFKAIRTDPAKRYRHAKEMLEDLRRLEQSGENSSEMNVVRNSHFIGAKQAILRGDYEEAIKIAQIGSENGAKDCQRLLAYSLYVVYGQQNPDILRMIIRRLDGLAYEGDMISLCIRALIHYQSGENEQGNAHLREAADGGCVIAQYIYGRWLWKGYMNLRRNREAGKDYMQKAASAGYYGALRYLKRMLCQDPSLTVSPSLKRFLDNQQPEDDEERKMWEDLVKFL